MSASWLMLWSFYDFGAQINDAESQSLAASSISGVLMFLVPFGARTSFNC
jgi:hypothetical protein